MSESAIVALSLLVFIGLLYKPVKKGIISALDNYAAEAIRSLDDAQAMFNEAENLVNDAKEELIEAKITAKEIVARAHKEAADLLAEAKSEAERITTKRAEIAMARITQQEQQIMDELKQEAIALAMRNVHTNLIKELDSKAQLSLIENGLTDIKKIIN
jgi:F-type H+-transporting ATPase subunit b